MILVGVIRGCLMEEPVEVVDRLYHGLYHEK